MRVVVTGGAGFIGANVCRALATDHATEVVAFDNLSTGIRANVEAIAGVTLVEGDILEPAALAAAFTGADSVVHLAARPSVPRSLTEPMASHAANATGTVNVLEAARQANVKQVIVASSSSVYGADPTQPKHEDLAPAPVSPYAASKLACESYALAWQRSYGLPTLAFRFFNVFGPLQTAGHAYAAVIPAFVSAALEGRALPVHGDGLQTRDFTYIGSVVAVITAAIERATSYPGPVNLAFGSRFSLLDVIALLEDIVGRPLERHHLPTRAGDVHDSQADNTRLRSLLPGIEPISLRDGLANTVAWFESLTGAS